MLDATVIKNSKIASRVRIAITKVVKSTVMANASITSSESAGGGGSCKSAHIVIATSWASASGSESKITISTISVECLGITTCYGMTSTCCSCSS